MTGTDLYVNKPHCVEPVQSCLGVARVMSEQNGDTLPHTVVGVCGEFQRTGRFLQRGI